MADPKTKRPRRSFTDEYKANAVRLVLDEGKSVSAAARDLDLTESSLRNWVERARADRGKGKPGVLTTVEREELTRLRHVSSFQRPEQSREHRPDGVARRAYERYEARGSEPSRDCDDWLQAERELQASDVKGS